MASNSPFRGMRDSVGIVVRVGEEPLSKLSTGLPVWEPKPKPFNVHQIVYSWRQYDVGQVEVHSGIFETFEWLEPNHVISIGHSEEKLYQKKNVNTFNAHFMLVAPCGRGPSKTKKKETVWIVLVAHAQRAFVS